MRYDVSNRDDRADIEHLFESEEVSSAQPAPPPQATAFFTPLLVAQTALWLFGVGLGIALFQLLWSRS